MFRLVPLTGIVVLLAGIILLPALSPPSKHQTQSVAFAETVKALQNVTYWRQAGWQIGFDPDGQSQGKPWFANDGASSQEIWFDAERGNFMEFPKRDGVTVQRDLVLPNGDFLSRRTLYVHKDGNLVPVEKVCLTHLGLPWWEKLRDDALRSRHDASALTNNMGNRPNAPDRTYQGKWREKTATIYEFYLAPPKEWLQKGAPHLHTLIYADPATHLPVAQQEFAYWRTPGTNERLVREWEYDYSQRPDPAIFDKNHFCAGAAEVQEQNGGPNVPLDPH